MATQEDVQGRQLLELKKTMDLHMAESARNTTALEYQITNLVVPQRQRADELQVRP